MTLADAYDDGVLRPGSVRYSIDEKVIYQPHRATIDELTKVLSVGSIERATLCSHLRSFIGWLPTCMVGGWSLWVRGPFVADLNQSVPEDLDLVVIGATVAGPPSWPLSVLAAGPISLHPGRLVVTALRQTGEDFELDREAVRSSRRCRNSDGEQLITGWIDLT